MLATPAGPANAKKRPSLGGEAIGGIRLGMTDKQVVAKLGRPSRRMPPVKEGKGHSEVWAWTQLDIGILFVGAKPPFKVRGIQITGYSPLKTTKGIGTRSSAKDVAAAYPSARVDGEDYTVGGDEGLVIQTAEGKVETIFLGRSLGP
jgi:hypothetical protein